MTENSPAVILGALMEGEPEQAEEEDVIERNPKGQFMKGTHANRSGRPKGSVSLVKLLKEHLEANPADADAIVASLLALGKGRDLPAVKELFDRVDGKAIERHKVDIDSPIKLIFVPAGQETQSKDTTDDEAS